ncbi:hypothetical protein C8R44DRAFT_760734 [Mycena epipterygia]|nr:hypothetical protein C8R44DRAFT_760734 [Mycena epipterygia]
MSVDSGRMSASLIPAPAVLNHSSHPCAGSEPSSVHSNGTCAPVAYGPMTGLNTNADAF